MSKWTHVAAIVRIDSVTRAIGVNEDWLGYFGKECLWNSSRECRYDAQYNPDDYLPMGSEESLRSSIWIDPDTHNVAAYTVMIFGDLRDYASPQTIIDWFKKKINGIPMVRQAVITVATEGIKTIVWNKEEY